MLSDFIVANCEFLAKFHVSIHDWLVVEATEHKLGLIITGLYEEPQPFALSGVGVRDLDFYVLALLISAAHIHSD